MRIVYHNDNLLDYQNFGLISFLLKLLANFQYEYNADDPPQTIRIIIQSMKWLLEYERAFADELREIAEKEANEFNEKEDKLEKEARTLKVNIS